MDSPLFRWYARERYARELTLAARITWWGSIAAALVVGFVAGLLVAASLVA